MVRTGRRADRLRDALQQTDLRPAADGPPPRPRLEDLPPVAATELLTVYRTLGGSQDAPTLRPGGWDLLFAGGLVVELDEELHFNRYRAVTLEASWSRHQPWRHAYAQHCAEHEGACFEAGRWGKRWTNPSAGRMFTGGPPGDLDAGAPRWKQRALYDAQKDAALIAGMPIALARVATHDHIGRVTLGAMLDGAAAIDAGAIRALVDARTARS